MVGEVQAAEEDVARGRAQHRKVKDKVRVGWVGFA